MTSKADWIALAERCEKATGTDREIDGDIAHAAKQFVDYLTRVPERPWLWAEFVDPDDWECWEAPEYTASLDAITAMIERELPKMQWLCRPDKEGGFANLYRRGDDGWAIMSWPCHAATPALALCAAFCRAMAEATQ